MAVSFEAREQVQGSDPEPEWRPAVLVIENLLTKSNLPILMRKDSMVIDSIEDMVQPDDGGDSLPTMDMDNITLEPEREVLCIFPKNIRYNLSLSEARHIAELIADLNKIH